jgi:hypothetical protein
VISANNDVVKKGASQPFFLIFTALFQVKAGNSGTCLFRSSLQLVRDLPMMMRFLRPGNGARIFLEREADHV